MEDQTKLKQEVLEFLKRNFVMNIAVSIDNKPSSSVLLYYVDDNFNFFFTTHADSFKAKILKSNPKISMSIWEHNQMLVQADGEVTEITEEEQKLKVIDKLAESASMKKDFWPPLLRIRGENYVVFKIIPNWLRKLDLTNNSISSINSPLTNITL